MIVRCWMTPFGRYWSDAADHDSQLWAKITHPLTKVGEMQRLDLITEDQLTRSLAYAGYVLLAFEMVRSLVVKPLKVFYANVTFGPGMPFKSYEEDVRGRHKKEFEACLLYLRDFVEAIDAIDYQAILDLREHRNNLAHELPSHLLSLVSETSRDLLDAAHKVIFKISNYQAYVDIGADPAFKGIDWSTAKGHEYILLETIIGKAKLLRIQLPDPPTISAHNR